MIAGLSGTLEATGADFAIVQVGGISFRVYLPTSTLSSLGPPGSAVRLHTHLQLKEDGAVLYGFATPEELRLFETLNTVSGIGPRLGLAMLSAMSAEQLVTAIATGSREMLTTVPGIGKKTAERIILELKDKVSTGWVISGGERVAEGNADVLAALSSLGYSGAEAARAVAAVPPSPSLSLEEKVKLALQQFGKR